MPRESGSAHGVQPSGYDSFVLTGAEIAITVLLVIPTAWALYDILRTPSESWNRSDQNQGIWVLVVLLIPLIGPVLYQVVAKPRLRARELSS